MEEILEILEGDGAVLISLSMLYVVPIVAVLAYLIIGGVYYIKELLINKTD